MSKSTDGLPELRPNYKLWLEHEGEYVFGPGAYAILKSIQDAGTISAGAKNIGMSYRYAWGVIRDIEKKIGVKLLDSYRGGTVGGGGARVTDYALSLMELYANINDSFEDVIKDSSKI